MGVSTEKAYPVLHLAVQFSPPSMYVTQFMDPKVGLLGCSHKLSGTLKGHENSPWGWRLRLGCLILCKKVFASSVCSNTLFQYNTEYELGSIVLVWEIRQCKSRRGWLFYKWECVFQFSYISKTRSVCPLHGECHTTHRSSCRLVIFVSRFGILKVTAPWLLGKLDSTLSSCSRRV